MAIYSIYATKLQLAEYLGIPEGSLPCDSQRLLNRASELIQQAVLFNFDSTNEDHVEAMKLATCAQVEAWNQIGESTQMMGDIKSYTIGDVSLEFSESTTGGRKGLLAERAKAYLNQQCLLYRGIKGNRVCREGGCQI